MAHEVLEKYSAQLGEILQHEVNVDATITVNSNNNYEVIKSVIRDYPDLRQTGSPRLLEIASYRHIIGYNCARELGFEATQFDLSDQDLRAARQAALQLGFPDTVSLVAGDFHDLPFSDGYFDLVFVAAAIHHTRRPRTVIGEAMRCVRDGGYFCCLREPSSRAFSFARFRGNKGPDFTAFERHLSDRQLLPLFSSPFPGTRNAILFDRVENDTISIDEWMSMLEQYGNIVRSNLSFEGLLTPLDRDILAHAELSEPELHRFIRDRIRVEVDDASSKLTRRDELLGFSLPDSEDIDSLSLRTAAAIKARPADGKSFEWRRDMARIFGASLRFVVRRTHGSPRADEQFRRATVRMNGVLLDEAIYAGAGVAFWTRLLPEIANSTQDEISAIFPTEDWTLWRNHRGIQIMLSKRDVVRIALPSIPSVTVVRYRFAVDDELPFARMLAYRGDVLVSDEIIPQSEDRVLKFVCETPSESMRIELLTLEGKPLGDASKSRLRVSVLQSIPLTGYLPDQPVAPAT